MGDLESADSFLATPWLSGNRHTHHKVWIADPLCVRVMLGAVVGEGAIAYGFHNFSPSRMETFGFYLKVRHGDFIFGLPCLITLMSHSTLIQEPSNASCTCLVFCYVARIIVYGFGSVYYPSTEVLSHVIGVYRRTQAGYVRTQYEFLF
jgi:hypothetical protein